VKNKFVKSTLILMLGGAITKILGMIIKIVTNRLIGVEGLGVYMLITPTFMLLIAIAQLGFPIAISKLVAEEKNNNKNLVFSSLPISLTINIIIMIILLFSSSYISNNLLHDKRTLYAIRSIGFVLPFISISSILRGYFFGKQRMFPHIISNVTEDAVRLITIIIGVPIALKKGIESAVSFIVLSNIVSELSSILVLFFFLPKNFKITKEDISPNKKNIKDILNISIPTTGSRLIGNIGYFLEPIILTFFLLKTGYANTYIVKEYGILNGYVMPMLLLPSFFTLAISQALIPIVSKSYSDNNIIYVKKKIKQSILFSSLIGIPATIIFILIPEIPLKLIYNTTSGSTYMKYMAPICLLYYFQAPLSSSLQAMGKAKDSLKGTIIGVSVKLIILAIGCNLKIGLWGLVISTCANIIVVTIYDLRRVKKYLKRS
jgi:stage V sporulation protein B